MPVYWKTRRTSAKDKEKAPCYTIRALNIINKSAFNQSEISQVNSGYEGIKNKTTSD